MCREIGQSVARRPGQNEVNIIQQVLCCCIDLQPAAAAVAVSFSIQPQHLIQHTDYTSLDGIFTQYKSTLFTSRVDHHAASI